MKLRTRGTPGSPRGPRAASATKKGNDGKAAKVTVLISGQPAGPGGPVLEGEGGTTARSPKADGRCVSEGFFFLFFKSSLTKKTVRSLENIFSQASADHKCMRTHCYQQQHKKKEEENHANASTAQQRTKPTRNKSALHPGLELWQVTSFQSVMHHLWNDASRRLMQRQSECAAK